MPPAVVALSVCFFLERNGGAQPLDVLPETALEPHGFERLYCTFTSLVLHRPPVFCAASCPGHLQAGWG